MFSVLRTLAACGQEATNGRAATTPNEEQDKKTSRTTPKIETKTDSSSELPLIFQKDEAVFSTQGTFRARIKVWKNGPQVTKNDNTRNSFSIEFATPSGHKPESFEVLKVSPDMKVHGHGVPRAYSPIWNIEDNLLNIDRLGFIMAGTWEITVQARIDGVEDSVEIPVVVP
jgi:hypothetical protein